MVLQYSTNNLTAWMFVVTQIVVTLSYFGKTHAQYLYFNNTEKH